MAHGWVCGPRIYKFKGWVFEYHPYCGPWPLKKDLQPRKKAGDVFWAVISEFDMLSDEDKKQYRIGGGCQQF